MDLFHHEKSIFCFVLFNRICPMTDHGASLKRHRPLTAVFCTKLELAVFLELYEVQLFAVLTWLRGFATKNAKDGSPWVAWNRKCVSMRLAFQHATIHMCSCSSTILLSLRRSFFAMLGYVFVLCPPTPPPPAVRVILRPQELNATRRKLSPPPWCFI